MSTLYNDPFNTYVDSYDPTSNESVIAGTNTFYFWINSLTKEIYLSTSPDITDILWRTLITSINLLDQIENSGWKLNTTRDYSPVSLAFDTGRMPNADVDTTVILTTEHASTLEAPAVVNIKIDTGSGYVSVANPGISGIDATMNLVSTFIVPKGSSYKIIDESGSNNIVSIRELPM